MPPPLICLDTCVLLPPTLRAVLIAAARHRVVTPVWSARTLEELMGLDGRVPQPGDLSTSQIAKALEEAFPSATVSATPGDGVPRLNAAGDQHVVDAAMAAGARLICTLNLRDFPAKALRPAGLAALPPDVFLASRLSPARAVAILARIPATGPFALPSPAAEIAPLLRRAGLRRVADLVEAGDDRIGP